MNVVAGHILIARCRKRFGWMVVSGLALLACSARTAEAQYYWATTGTGLWSIGANWSTSGTSGGPYGTVPTDSRTAHTAYFNQSTVNGDTTVELSGSRSILGMVFNNTGSTLIRASASGTQSLSVGQGGMTVNAGAGPVTIGDATNTVPTIIWPNSGASSITNHSSSLLRFVNGINNLSSPLTFTGTGTGGVQVDGRFENGSALVKSGSGTLAFTGATIVNTATISSGTLAITGAGSIGGGTWGNSPYLSLSLTNNGAFVYSSSARSVMHTVTGTGSMTMAGSGMLSLTGGGGTGPLTISSGTLHFSSYNAAYPSNVTNPTISNNGTLIIDTSDGSGTQPIYAGSISGTGRMIVTGPFSNGGTWPLFRMSGSNSFTGPLEIQAGTVSLTFSGTSGFTPTSNILSPSVNVAFGSNFGSATPDLPYAGSTTSRITPRVSTWLTVTGSAGQSRSQSLAGLTINDGMAIVTATASAASATTLSVGSLQRSTGSRGVVVFWPYTTGTATILTTATNGSTGIIGPWALRSNGAGSVLDWAASTSGTVTAFAGYASDTWASGSNTNVTAASTVPAGAVTNSLRFGSNQTVTLAGAATVSSGGILFSSAGTLTGGVLRGPAAGGLQITTNGAGTIASAIADNGGPTGLTYLPFAGSLTLGGNNTYTGPTYIAGSVTANAVETGTSGPLGVGGQIQFPTNGTGQISSMGGGVLAYGQLTSADYSTRISATSAQTIGVAIGANQRVTWAGSIGGNDTSLAASAPGAIFSGNGVLVLSGSNNFARGVDMGIPVVLASASALGSVGPVNPGAGNLRYTAASAGLDLGARITQAWGTQTVGIDTNGQNVTWTTRAAASQAGTSFVKRGFGQLTLSGSLVTQTVVVAGGTLALDASLVSSGTIWRETSNNTPAGISGRGVGTFRFSGAAGAARTLTITSVDLQQGLLTLAVDNVLTGTSMIDTTSIGRSLQLGTVDFRAVNGTLGSTSVIRTATSQALANGILGPWATVNGTDWATHLTGTIQPYAAYTDVSAGTLADSGTSNARIASAGGTVTLGSATTTVNTLLQSATTAATISLPSQILRTGGVMIGRNAAGLTIGDTPGSGTLQTATANGEIVLSNFGSGTMTVNSAITTNGTAARLTISGDGRVVLTGSNVIQGNVSVQGGTLVIGDGGLNGLITGTTGDVVLAPGATIEFNRSDNYGGFNRRFVQVGVSGGIGGYARNYGGGVVVRNGNLSISAEPRSNEANMLLLGGTMTITNDGNYQGMSTVGGLTGEITFGGGILKYANGTGGTQDVSSRIVNSTGPIAVDSGGNANQWRWSIAASNTAGLTKLGVGTLALCNVNYYSGPTTVEAGVLQTVAQGIPGDVVNSGTLSFNNDPLGIGGVYAGVISGTGTVVASNTSAFIPILSGSSTFATVPVVQQGRLDIGWSAPAGQPSPLGTSGTVSVGTVGTGRLGYSGATNLTFNRVVNLAGTTIGGGLAADGAGAFIVTSNLAISGNGSKTFSLAGSGTAANEMRGVIPNYDGSGLTALNKTGDGLWWVTGTNTFTGKTSITGGTLVVDRLTNSGTAGPLGMPTTNAAIEIGSTSGLAALRYAGTGHSTNRSITLTGTGTLEAAGSGAATFGTVTGTAGQALVLAGTSTANNTIGAINGAGVNVTKTGSGLWRLTGAGNYTGQLTVSEGTLVVASSVSGGGPFGQSNGDPVVGSSAAGVTGTVSLFSEGIAVSRGFTVPATGAGSSQAVAIGSLGSGTASFGGTIKLGRGVTLQAATSGTVQFDSTWQDLSGGSSPAVPITIGSDGNAGTVILGSALPASVTSVSIVRGTAQLNELNDDRIDPATPVTIGSAGGTATLDVNGRSQSLTTLAFAGNSSRIISSDNTVTNGTLRLGLVGSSASVTVGGTGHMIDSLVALDALASFNVNAASRLTIASEISGDGGLTKAGSGALNLTGTSIYSGVTTVSAGSLLVNGRLSNSNVTVQSGGILGGSGRIAGGLTGDGLIAPGNSPGILAVDGQITPTGTTSFAFEFTGASPTWSNATASVNDILRLTNVDPFASGLTSGNVVNVYFDMASLANGDTFLGGFYSDRTSGQLNFLGEIGSPTYAFYVYGDGLGSAASHGGKSYYTLAQYNPSLTGATVTVATVPEADFAGGTVTDGQVTQFVIVPEPTSLALAALGVAAAYWARRRRHAAVD